MSDKTKLEAYSRMLGKIYDAETSLAEISHLAKRVDCLGLEQEAVELAHACEFIEQELNTAYDKELSND